MMGNMSPGILIVDDEIGVCRSLQEILADKGYASGYETDPARVMAHLAARKIDVVLMDLRMPNIGGIDLLRLIKTEHPHIVVIVISGHATVDNAVRAMKYGAFDLFTKPIRIPLLLNEIAQVAASIEQRRVVDEDDAIVTQDPATRALLAAVETAAPTDAAVLIAGESGTGKELIANTLHRRSPRRNHPFIKVNCASIPDTLLESEMFGHERGAFTDATERKQGLLELASGGSIFLDEIGDMSPRIQAKMLRVLEDKRFLRVGGSEILRANCRVIAASNHDLTTDMKKGLFREDLYYRLAVISLHVGPLRERRLDILPLAEHFLAHFGRVYSRPIALVSDEVKEILLSHTWPGNIRELRNFVERAVVFSRSDTIEIADIPEQYRGAGDKGRRELAERYDGVARDVIVEALSLANGKRQDAARLLRIDRKTLYNRMKKFRLT
jgi:DNA-binding NtrC family response regulator